MKTAGVVMGSSWFGPPRQTLVDPAPHPVFPTNPVQEPAQQLQPASPLPPTHLGEMLRALRGRRLDRGDLVTAGLVGLAINELDTRLAVINSLKKKIAEEREKNVLFMHSEWITSGPLLPGELPRQAPPLPMRDNPPPDSRSPLEVIVSQKMAIRCLVRHYGWTHHGANILFRPDWPGGHVVTSPHAGHSYNCDPAGDTTPHEPDATAAADDDQVEQLQESPGSIATAAAAAALEQLQKAPGSIADLAAVAASEVA